MVFSEQAGSRLKLAAAIATGALAYHWAFWAPVSQAIQRAQADLDESRGLVDRAKRQAVRIPKIQAELVALNEAAVKTEPRLHKIPPRPHDIDWVERLASRAGVTLSDVVSAKPKVRQYFIENHFEVTASATYEGLRRFLSELAREERIVDVAELRLGPPSPGSGPPTGGKRHAVFRLVFFQYKG